MDMIKSFFGNKWTKRCVSVFSIVFLVILLLLDYMAMFYDVQITNLQSFLVTIIIVSLVLGAIMIYTRKNFITSLVSMLSILVFLPLVLLCFGNWALLIPLAIVSVVMFFTCNASENTKTILGTIYVMLFIMGAIAYLLYTSLIVGQTQDSKSESYISNSQTYRCYIVDTVDSSTGSTKIYVEPNDYDVNYNGISFIAEGYQRIVYNVRERKSVDIEWRDDDLYVDGQLRFRHSDATENDWFEFKTFSSRIDSAKEYTSSIIERVSKKLKK